MFAAHIGDTFAVIYLLRRGACLHLVTKGYLHSILHLACNGQRIQCAIVLIRNGADFEHQDAYFKTCVDYVISEEDRKIMVASAIGQKNWTRRRGLVLFLLAWFCAIDHEEGIHKLKSHCSLTNYAEVRTQVMHNPRLVCSILKFL